MVKTPIYHPCSCGITSVGDHWRKQTTFDQSEYLFMTKARKDKLSSAVSRIRGRRPRFPSKTSWCDKHLSIVLKLMG